MKVFLVDQNFHEKNKQGFLRMVNYLGWNFASSLEEADLVYSPNRVLDPSKYPSKKFLFGPHLGVYPQVLSQIKSIQAIHNNAFYIQPSLWVTSLFQLRLHTIQVKQLAFPVDTERFQPGDKKEKTVLLYYKRRDPSCLIYAKKFLEDNKISYIEFVYGKYKEEDFIKALKRVSCALWIGCHESQGFALGETLASDVPVCVWNVQTLKDEWGGGRPDIPATTCAYWSPLCGEVFYQAEELEKCWQTFDSKLHLYRPREFVLKELSVEACAKRLNEMLN